MSPTIRPKYKYFHSTVQSAKDRRQKFHFRRLPFDVRPRGNVKLSYVPQNVRPQTKCLFNVVLTVTEPI